MSSTLTFQLRQQYDKGKRHRHAGNGLPSPPNSSYGDETGSKAGQDSTARSGTSSPRSTSTSDSSRASPEGDRHGRSDSLPTHFNALTLQHYSTSLPENYTIDHSSPIPIQSLHKPIPSRAESPSQHSSLSPVLSTAIAAGTGGRTIRNGRRSAEPGHIATSASSLGRKSRVMSESNKSFQTHRCEECGKVYKHPNCLAKHRWEHSEEWELTSKLLLTKHQQVQMLEAAAILVSMDAKRVEQRKQQQQQQQHYQQSFYERSPTATTSHASQTLSSAQGLSDHDFSDRDNDDDDDISSIEIDDQDEDNQIPSTVSHSHMEETFILDD